MHLTVEAPDEILNAGAYDAGALIQIQSSATEAGAFADLSGTGSTPTIAVVTAVRSYTGYDPNGTSSTWYRTRYKNAAGTRTSDWTAAFQIGDEAAGLLCSLYDARQRLFPPGTTDTSEDENLLGYIAQVTRFVEGYCERWFAPRPFSGTATYLFSPEVTGRRLWVPKGIRSITSIGYATTDQPDTGGTYTAITASDAALRPGPIDRDAGWPATSIQLLDTSGVYFYAGVNRVQIVGGFGFTAVPPDIEKIALNLVVAAHRERGSSGAGDSVTYNIDGSRTFERSLSYSDRMTLNWYRAGPI
jgi:hypothetical protein